MNEYKKYAEYLVDEIEKSELKQRGLMSHAALKTFVNSGAFFEDSSEEARKNTDIGYMLETFHYNLITYWNIKPMSYEEFLNNKKWKLL